MDHSEIETARKAVKQLEFKARKAAKALAQLEEHVKIVQSFGFDVVITPTQPSEKERHSGNRNGTGREGRTS